MLKPARGIVSGHCRFSGRCTMPFAHSMYPLGGFVTSVGFLHPKRMLTVPPVPPPPVTTLPPALVMPPDPVAFLVPPDPVALVVLVVTDAPPEPAPPAGPPSAKKPTRLELPPHRTTARAVRKRQALSLLDSMFAQVTQTRPIGSRRQP